MEVVHSGNTVAGDLKDALGEATRDSLVEILKVKDLKVLEAILESDETAIDLEELSPEDVFIRLLEATEVAQEQQNELLMTYKEALIEVEHQDQRAE